MDSYDNYNNQYDPFLGEYREPQPNKPKKPKKRKKNTLMVVALCVVCALVGALIQPAVSHLVGGKSTVYTGVRTPTEITSTGVDTSKELTCAEIYANYVGSCVGITVDIVSTNVFGQTVTGAAAGSGFVITQDGYILTNYHVIENANSIKVTFVDGTEYPATLIGGEEQNDIAVIKIKATGLTPVVIGSSGDMLVGEQVTTIGNPMGELTFSESTGIISAKDRAITMSDGTVMNMIQTDCAINSGNSGGPLFNHHGEVIGIVSAKYSSNGYSSAATIEGLGFAIPMDDVADMVKDLITKGYVTGKPMLGISVGDVEESALSYGVPEGAAVLVVTPGLCAEKAGLQAGDIITKFGEKTIENKSQLIEAKNACKPGDAVNMTVYRSGQTLTLTVTLDESTPETVAKQEQAQQEYQQSQQSQQSQQQQQQQQQQQDNWGSWPFGSWPFGY